MTDNNQFLDGLEGQELSWDSEIEHDSEFVLLEPGEYDFEVLSFERARHNGSAKLPPCWKAVLKLRISNKSGATSIISHNLFLHSSLEGLLCSFFTAIGQRKHGERMKMNWPSVPGSRGRAEIEVHEWQGKDGKTMKNNQIRRFLEPKESKDTNPAAKSFTPGAF